MSELNLLEVELRNPDDFLKIKETLTRIGVASYKEKKLYQSCHILHKRGKYYIVHFKELFLLDGRQSSLSEEDVSRRNTITKLLQEWDLVKIVSPETMSEFATVNSIKIVPYKYKHNWKLEAKYTIGFKH
jgi:hypothetical protein